MTEITRNDLMYFQNEVLSDLKKLENKINIKLEKSLEQMQIKLDSSEEMFNLLSNRITEISNLISQINTNNSQITSLVKYKSKSEEEISILETRINLLEKDLSNTKFNFEKLIQSSLTFPGIVGEGGKFLNFKVFIEYVNKSLINLNNFKDINTIDFKNYKEKLENLITQFKIKFDVVQNKCMEYSNNKFTEFEKVVDDKIKYLEEKIDNLRVENNKYSTNLIDQSKRLKIDLDNLNEYKKGIENMIKLDYEKFRGLHYELLNKFEKNDNEFKFIKIKFTELSEFIKDVRFRKNINVKEFKDMSKKIDFSKKNKLNKLNGSYSMSDINRSDYSRDKNLEEDFQNQNYLFSKKLDMKNLNIKKNNIEVNIENNPLNTSKTNNENENKKEKNIINTENLNKNQNLSLNQKNKNDINDINDLNNNTISHIRKNSEMNNLLYKIKRNSIHEKNKSISLNTITNNIEKHKFKKVNPNFINEYNGHPYKIKNYFYSSLMKNDNLIDIYKKIESSQNNINKLEEKMNKKIKMLNDLMNELMDKKIEKKKLKTLYINSENLCNIKMPNVDSFLYGYSLKKIARSSSKKTPQNFNSTTKIMESSLTKSSSNGNHFVKVNQLINNDIEPSLNNDNKYIYIKTNLPYSIQK